MTTEKMTEKMTTNVNVALTGLSDRKARDGSV